MEIRPLCRADSRPAISRIYEICWKSAYRGIVPQDYLDGIPAGRWTDALDRADWDTLVLTKGERLVGTSSVCPSRWPDYSGFGEIVSLYLLPEFQGQGYGRALLEAAAETLAGLGFQDILLWVLEENWRARSFYEKAGFRFSGDFMVNEIGGKPLREALYCRRSLTKTRKGPASA